MQLKANGEVYKLKENPNKLKTNDVEKAISILFCIPEEKLKQVDIRLLRYIYSRAVTHLGEKSSLRKMMRISQAFPGLFSHQYLSSISLEELDWIYWQACITAESDRIEKINIAIGTPKALKKEAEWSQNKIRLMLDFGPQWYQRIEFK